METWKCDKCGATWCWLRGDCPCCDGGAIRPQPEREEDESNNITHALGRGFCPDCGSTKLRGGPSGGLSQNVLCENCRAEFNAGIFSERLAKPCDPQRQKEVYGMEAMSCG